MAVKLPVVVSSGELQQLQSADTLSGAGPSVITFGNKNTGGLATGVLPFVIIASSAATIIGWWIRHNATSVTLVFLKKASDAEPSYPTDSINVSGLTGSTGITKSTTLTDFTTVAISTDDVIVPYITSITGTLTAFECGLIVQKQ